MMRGLAVSSAWAGALYFFRAGVARSRGLAAFEVLRIVLMGAILLTWVNVWAMVPDGFWVSAGFSFSQIVWYICCTEIVAFSVPGVHRDIEAMIREGQFVSTLSRPLSWLIIWLFEQVGRVSVFLFLFAGASLAVAFVATGVWLLSPVGLAMLAVHLLLAQAIWIVWLTVIGLVALWAGSTAVPYMIIQKFAFIFGGLLMPLALYPGWLSAIAYMTPFPAIFGVVGEVVLDSSLSHFAVTTAYQGLVLAGSFAVLLFVWRRFTTCLLQEG